MSEESVLRSICPFFHTIKTRISFRDSDLFPDSKSFRLCWHSNCQYVTLEAIALAIAQSPARLNTILVPICNTAVFPAE